MYKRQALKSHEAKTAETPFTINLTGCPLAQNISISLEGTPDTNANGTTAAVLALSDAADTAKGVGIEVFSSPDGSTEGTQLTFDKQSKTAVSQADENGDIAFNFIADLKSDSSLDVTAGNINATANIDIVTKKDEPGIDIIIKPGTKNESVHIPVILSESGLKDMVYNLSLIHI